MLGIVVLLLSGCGGGSEGAPSASATGSWAPVPLTEPEPPVLSKLSRSSRLLDLEALSADALEPEALATVLKEAGFQGGSELEYTGRTEVYSHVVLRILTFPKPAGAGAYLEWLDAHAADILGPVKSREPLAVGSDGILLLEQGCNCHSDLPTYLAAWRAGAVVRTLLADGAGANARRVRSLARELG